MLKKYIKTLSIKPYSPDSELEGHIFSLGRIGGGKSVSTKSIIEGYKDNKGYKIFDIYGGERHEGIYWALPSLDKEYWKKLEILGKPDEEGPKQYQVDLLYPFFESKFPKKLPKKEPYVNSIPFTIPLKSVEIDDIRMVLGKISETGIFFWNEIINKLKKENNSGILKAISKELKATKTILYKNFILPMYREKFLMDSNFNYNLDLIKESKNKDVVTVLCLEFVPKRFHLFVINYIIRKLIELIESNKIPKKNILFIREAATFFRATEDSVLEDRLKIFRTFMSHYIRMGRRGTYFALDCQSASEVRGLVQGSEDYLLMFKTTSWRDKSEMCDELKRERRMRPDQVAGLAFLEKGECYIAETGKVVKKVKITLPRSAYWKKEYGNFYKNLWERYGGEWKNVDNIREQIKDLTKIEKERYIEKMKKFKIMKESLNKVETTKIKTEKPLEQDIQIKSVEEEYLLPQL